VGEIATISNLRMTNHSNNFVTKHTKPISIG